MYDVRSDQLPELTTLHAEFGGAFPNRLLLGPWVAVIDANEILNAISYKLRKAPDCRVMFEELAAAGVLTLYAPKYLEKEVLAHIPECAKRCGMPEDAARAMWFKLRAFITFCPTRPLLSSDALALARRDPKDVPYLQVFEEVDADFLLSSDSDFEETQLLRFDKNASRSVLGAVKNHARIGARVLELEIAAGGATISAVEIGRALHRGYNALSPGTKQILLAVIAAASAFAVLYPPARRKVLELVERAADTVGPTLLAFGEELQKGWKEADEGRKTVEEALPPPKKVSLGTLCFRVLVRRGSAMLLKEIVNELGDSLGKEQTRHDVWLALRSDGRLQQDITRRWSVRLDHPEPPDSKVVNVDSYRIDVAATAARPDGEENGVSRSLESA